MVRLQVLGPVSVTIDGGEAVHLRPQTRRLAALLLAADGQPVAADRIADVLGLAEPGGSAFRMALSRLRSIVWASSGKSDSIMTMLRRRSRMWTTCSMSTGHCSTHAPHVVHDHRTSGSMTPSSPAPRPSGL